MSQRARSAGLVPAISLVGRPVPERKWLVEDLVPWGAVTLFSGHGGDGKSLLALQLAVAAATGDQWLGLPVQQVKALVVSCEDDEAEMHRRLADITTGLGKTLGDLEDLELWDRVGSDNRITVTTYPEKAIEATPFWVLLRNYVIENGVQLLVLDSLYDFYAGNQNSQEDATAFMTNLRELAREMDGAVFVLWHPSQAGRTSGDGLSGNLAFHNKARGRLYLHRPGSEDGEDYDPDVRIITNKKSNYGRTGDDITVRWRTGLFVRDNGGGSGTVEAIERRNAEKAVLTCLSVLLNDGFDPSPAVEARGNYAPRLMRGRPEVRGLTEREIEKAVHRLISAGEVVQTFTDDKPSRRKKIIAPADHPRAKGPGA
ncbi:MAG: AAA family ATPase [Caenispirillum bisanense]|nr:AAA family ATPase [Caenispirillum bisanense]